MAARRSLTSRPMDLFYFIFFLMHIPTTLLVDCQAIWPKQLVPEFVQAIIPWYVRMSGDPLIGGAMGLLANESELAWFKSFVYLEALFQLPVFVLGARGLWLDSQEIYGLLVLYGASTCTTTLACVVTILNTPTTSAATIAQKIISITSEQRVMLLSSYIPFFLIPLYLAIDMALRLQKLASAGFRTLESSKQD
ncbi:transmembrane protein 6/97 [Lactifluus subvellereus]|nr:transmembrane protein 6/97 [Lactifluus subvellereus]